MLINRILTNFTLAYKSISVYFVTGVSLTKALVDRRHRAKRISVIVFGIQSTPSNAKISAVRSLADICFLHVLIRVITCIILSVCVSVFLVLSILHTVI